MFVGPFVCHEFAASGKQHIPKEITEEIKKSDRKLGERFIKMEGESKCGERSAGRRHQERLK